MGAGSSSSFGLSTSDANKMLTQIFTQTDMDSYLTMVNPAACAKFDFSSLTPGMRKDIQAVGGILRAPGQNAQNVEICFQQAKGYSKAFEIFAALYAILADFSVKRTIGGRRTRRTQRGGAVVAITQKSKGYTKITSTPLYALWLIPNFSFAYDDINNMIIVRLSLTEQAKGIEFKVDERALPNILFTQIPGLAFDTRKKDKKDCTVSFSIVQQSRDDTEYAFTINGEQILVIDHFSTPESWSYSELPAQGNARVNEKRYAPVDLVEGKRGGNKTLSSALINKIKELVLGADSTYGQAYGQVGQAYGQVGQAYGQPVQAYGQASVGQVGQPAPRVALAGSFFPQGPANIKGVLRNIKDNKKGKPIALAIARALILLKQIDPANSQGNPTTQVCATRYSFEGTETIVPRKGIALDRTFYFKTWINLYNDIGEYRGGKYEWTQSMDGKRELDEAAKDLSILYSNPLVQSQPDPTFLSKPLPDFMRVCPNKYDRDYMLSPEVLPQIQAVVKELLQLQDTYVKKANAILAKVFTFKADGSVSFRPEVMGGQGFLYISAVCAETRHTLFEYYMKVESLFIKGIIVYEKALNNNQLRQL